MGSWSPPDGAEWEFVSAERQDKATGRWLPLLNGEWLETGCRAALDAADEYQVIEALTEREYD
jgi:hypothetical protein